MSSLPRPALPLVASLCMATAAMAIPPARTTILSGQSASDVLRQCSRPAPSRGSGFFRPDDRQIVALDRTASAASRRRLSDARDLQSIRRNYAVEVIGIVRAGHRFVYGNYYPLMMQDGMKDAPVGATVVCDGGPRLFGVEIDASTGRLTHIAFNGR